MKQPIATSNGKSLDSARVSVERTRPLEPKEDDVGVTLVANHEIDTHLRNMKISLRRENPAMAVLFDTHMGQIRWMMMTALRSAIQSERRRLSWLTHNDLAGVLSAAHERLTIAMHANTEGAVTEALQEVEACLITAARATRGLIADLKPSDAEGRKADQ